MPVHRRGLFSWLRTPPPPLERIKMKLYHVIVAWDHRKLKRGKGLPFIDIHPRLSRHDAQAISRIYRKVNRVKDVFVERGAGE